MLRILIILISMTFFLEASLVGNPSSPAIFTDGLISKNQTFYIRGGYFYYNIYRAKYKEEIITEESPTSFLKIISQGAIITANIKNRWDIYSLLGVSHLNLDDQIKTNERFSFAVGTKLILLKIKNFDFTIDGKYFRTSQNAEYIINEKEIFPIITPHYNFLYQEIQGAFGVSYKINIIIPYVGVTYLYSTITPRPFEKGLIRYPYPNEDTVDDFITRKTKNSKSWGAIVGICLVAKNKININIESRMVDQNAVNISSEIRF